MRNRSIGRVVEVEEHLVVRERKPVRLLELPIEIANERGVDAEEAAPRGELASDRAV